MQFQLIRNAKVEVKKVVSTKGKPIAVAEIDGKFQHRFPVRSRVSKHLELMTSKDLSKQMTGGHYFFIGDQLVDFKYGSSYANGFVHSDEALKALFDHLGYQQLEAKERDEDDKVIKLRKVWSDSGITVPGYKDGGDFNSRLSFSWSPFVRHVSSNFEIVRLICTNGMMGLTSLLQNKIPLQNKWQEHLDIANKQIQNKINGLVTNRVKLMDQNRASVGDCSALFQHCKDRLEKVEDVDQLRRLATIRDIVDPQKHLNQFYMTDLFENGSLAKQVPSHLTEFDVYNIATEIRTHSKQTSKSTDHALDRIANRLMFNESARFNVNHGSLPKQSAFSDPATAFFGQLH